MNNSLATLLGLAISVVVGAAAPAMASSEGRLLFSNPNTGKWQTAAVDPSGTLVVGQWGAATLFNGITQEVATPSFITIYNGTTGHAQAQFIDSSGVATGGPFFNFSANWRTIISSGNYLFFNNGPSAAIVRTNPDGSVTQTFSANNFSSWSNIISTDNYLFFYNGANGAMVTGHITDGGTFVQTQSALGTANYTLATSLGDDVLLYNQNTGAWESGEILFTGQDQTDHYQSAEQSTAPTLGLGYTYSASLNGHLMLYNGITGAAAIGHFKPGGQFALDRKINMGLYTQILRCGQFLAFYSWATGTMTIGYIDSSSKFVTTQSQNVGAFWFNIAATRN